MDRIGDKISAAYLEDAAAMANEREEQLLEEIEMLKQEIEELKANQ